MPPYYVIGRPTPEKRITPLPPPPPEYNVTGIDYGQRRHLTYRGPLLAIHSHVVLTRPANSNVESSIAQAETMLGVAAEFGIERRLYHVPTPGLPPLREHFDERLAFNGSIAKKSLEETDEAVFARLERFLELGVVLLKFRSAPRGRDRGLVVDAPWRIEAIRR